MEEVFRRPSGLRASSKATTAATTTLFDEYLGLVCLLMPSKILLGPLALLYSNFFNNADRLRQRVKITAWTIINCKKMRQGSSSGPS